MPLLAEMEDNTLLIAWHSRNFNTCNGDNNDVSFVFGGVLAVQSAQTNFLREERYRGHVMELFFARAFPPRDVRTST
jgi:hypothetical protein